MESRRKEIKKFYKQILSDPKLKEKIVEKAKKIATKEALRKLIREEIMPLMKRFKVNFSEEELLEYELETLKKLSKKDFANVSGGVSVKSALLAGGILSMALIGGVNLAPSIASADSGKGTLVQTGESGKQQGDGNEEEEEEEANIPDNDNDNDDDNANTNNDNANNNSSNNDNDNANANNSNNNNDNSNSNSNDTIAGDGWSFENSTGTLTISTDKAIQYSEWIELISEDQIKEVVLGPDVTFIGKSAFWNCSSLTQISIPASVTSIGESAFWNCSSLTQISIPASVTLIEDGAFVGCSNLKFVDFLGTNEPGHGQEIFEESSVTAIVPWNYNGNTFCGLPVSRRSGPTLELESSKDGLDDLSLILRENDREYLRDFSKDWLVSVGDQARELINYIKSYDISSFNKKQLQRLIKNLNHVLKQVKKDENGNLYLNGKWHGRDNIISNDDIVRLQELKKYLEGKIV